MVALEHPWITEKHIDKLDHEEAMNAFANLKKFSVIYYYYLE